jgi:hypothetical protein
MKLNGLIVRPLKKVKRLSVTLLAKVHDSQNIKTDALRFSVSEWEWLTVLKFSNFILSGGVSHGRPWTAFQTLLRR